MRLKSWMNALVGAVALACIANISLAEERVALVIGNGSYSTVSPLDNPSADATLIASRLEQLDFDVTLLVDADFATFQQGIAAFGRQLREAGPTATGLFYYAGHGVQSFGENYLLPVDVALNDPADLDFVAIETQSVLRQMFSARNGTNIVILDACRNNPFTDIPEFGENGLAEMKAPTGTFLSYATAPGAVALDGQDGNSPFTAALAEEMVRPGVPLEEVFRNVRVAVLEATNGLQTPWDTSSLTSEFAFAPQDPAEAAALGQAAVWEKVREAADPLQVTLYLQAYPDGPYADEARILLNSLVGTGPRPNIPAQAEPGKGGYAALGTGAAQAPPPAPGSQAERLAAPAPAPEAEADPAPAPITETVSFDTPISEGLDQIVGLTIDQVIQGSPAFPPVEGLPEEIWQGRTCSTCHQWERADLCTQAGVYLQADTARSLDKQHPFGGGFKRHLARWAKGGCD